jgi:hypothetical protein
MPGGEAGLDDNSPCMDMDLDRTDHPPPATPPDLPSRPAAGQRDASSMVPAQSQIPQQCTPRRCPCPTGTAPTDRGPEEQLHIRPNNKASSDHAISSAAPIGRVASRGRPTGCVHGRQHGRMRERTRVPYPAARDGRSCMEPGFQVHAEKPIFRSRRPPRGWTWTWTCSGFMRARATSHRLRATATHGPRRRGADMAGATPAVCLLCTVPRSGRRLEPGAGEIWACMHKHDPGPG